LKQSKAKLTFMLVSHQQKIQPCSCALGAFPPRLQPPGVSPAAFFALSETGNGRDHARFNFIKAVIAKSIARIAFADPTVQPSHARFVARPFEKGLNATWQRYTASIPPMMHNQSGRQFVGRAQDRLDVE